MKVIFGAFHALKLICHAGRGCCNPCGLSVKKPEGAPQIESTLVKVNRFDVWLLWLLYKLDKLWKCPRQGTTRVLQHYTRASLHLDLG